MTMSDDFLFPPPAPQPAPEPPRVIPTEAHAKLARNLDTALDVHHAAMSANLPDVPLGDKRLMVESANSTLKASFAVDRSALRARRENSIEVVMLRIYFTKKLKNIPLDPEDELKLRSTPRGKLEAALGERGLAEYDEFEWETPPP
jgi:hypothetical protein